jgi:Holliday junction DNA helicase RuvA
MIGKLKGLVDSVGEEFAIIDVGGVGYLVRCSARTLQNLPRAGEAVSLAIETQVREDAITLYGFTGEAEKEWFRLLQSVQGVGAKVALAVLSTLKPDDLSLAVSSKDKLAVARTPGVGPKLAERIVNELAGKGPAAGAPLTVGAVSSAELPTPVQDALSALVNLGYGQSQAASAIAAARRALREDASTGELIRQGLKELAR